MPFNGNDLVLAIGAAGSEVKFAHAQTASISFSNALVDTTTKDSDSWEDMISGRKSFTISTDGLADFEDVTAAGTKGFSATALAGNMVSFTFERTATTTSGSLTGWTGNAFIESFEISAGSDEAVTYSVSLKGTGELMEVSVA